MAKRRIDKSSINDEYYNWLLSLVGIYEKQNTYSILLKTLYKKNFYWTVPNDDNRAFEGRGLRDKFYLDFGISPSSLCYDLLDGDCTMLELIIGLAYRCESITDDPKSNMKMRDWFWLLLSNCGLDSFTDDDYFCRHNGLTVHDIIDIIIDRSYKRNGDGGLFPLRKNRRDQRKVELWYQMCSYLVENYYTEDISV